MDAEAVVYTEIGESYQGYCCKPKHYYSQDYNMVKKIEITPRIIIYKQRLKITQTYSQTIRIKNNGLYPRRLKYSTDSPLDILIEIEKVHQIEDLPADETIAVNIILAPKDKTNINRRRHIYITSEHPNVIFEVPIIIVDKQSLPSIPEIIKFPSTIPKTKTFYEFAAYNQKSDESSIVIKCSNPSINFILDNTRIPKRDYVKVLLSLNVKDLNALRDVLKLKLENKTFVDLPFEHEPIARSIYIGTQHLMFEALKFSRNAQKGITACNETQEPLQFTLKFLTEVEEIDDDRGSIKFKASESEESEVVLSPISSLEEISETNTKKLIPKKKTYTQDVVLLDSHRHFGINTKGGQIKPNSSNTFIVVFHPIMDAECCFDDDVDGPFLLATKLIFQLRSELETVTKSIFVSGLVNGPIVQFTPRNIDIKKIYLGEEYCHQITALNVDGQVNAVVKFEDYTLKGGAVCEVTPTEGFDLESCKKEVFTLTMFMKTVGKFLIMLKFKVKNGDHYFVNVRGISRQVRPKAHPEIVEMGNLPIAVPQKRQVLLMNPLSVPMTLHIVPTEDGHEAPLTLNIIETRELLPITIKNPIKVLESLYNEYDEDEFSAEFTSRSISQKSYKSYGDNSSDSSYSARFEEEILDTIPKIAHDLVKCIKDEKFFEKSEVDKRIMNDALKSLTNLKYFDDFQYTNYKIMDWNAVPSDPREIYVDSEVIHLSPNTGRVITVLVIPNRVGYFSRTLDVRCAPYNPFTEEDKIETWVDSSLMVSKLYLEYNCRVPHISWDDFIDFEDRVIYAYQAYPFQMCFENLSNVGGFFYYDVVPKCEDGEMFFVDNTWKHFLSAGNYIYTYCAVIFKKLGDIKMSGMMKFLGITNGKPFQIKAHVLPTKVVCNPTTIHRRFSVLQYKRVYIFIENLTPTRTWFTLTLENEDFTTIEPEGSILSPVGQGICAILHLKYYDPDVYKNILYVNVKGGYITEIPINFNIEEMPILFEPNIKKGLFIGVILTNSEKNFCAEIPNFSTDIKVINGGYRSYRLKIQTLKIGNTKCGKMESRARINITTNILLMSPQSNDVIHVTANACDEAEITNEFIIQIVDQTNRKRFQNIRFLLSAKFVTPELIWSRKEITMTYCRTHKFKEFTQMELVKLVNCTDTEIGNINIRVTGPFKIRELFEHPFKKELDISLNGAEKRELTILLDKNAIVGKTCTHIDGRLLCTGGGKIQRPLYLRVNILGPVLSVAQPEIILFRRDFESMTGVEIENVGCLDAAFKWKKIDETTNFVAESDYPKDFAREILSDIFCMLELSEDDECFKPLDSMENMTAHYQECRCKLIKYKSSIDPIGITDILYEIIEKLDLEHKRYMMRLGQDELDSCSSVDSCVEKTIDRILHTLHLEDSYQISDISSDDCQRESTMYFHQKCGVLAPQLKELCLLHLPAVRIGYEKEANFQLDVVGGFSQIVKIVLVNLERAVILSPDNIYLGMQPWYEVYRAKVQFQNVSDYAIKSCLEEKPIAKVNKQKLNRLADGHVDILTQKCFNVNSLSLQLIKFTGIMGFGEKFVRDIKATINDSEEKFIRLRGQGIMPMFSVTDGHKHLEQSQPEIELEYKLLQQIYYFDCFAVITREDEELSVHNEETCARGKAVSQIEVLSLISLSSNSSTTTTDSRETARNLRFFKLLQTYVMVNHNEELPNAMLLEQLMEMEKFRHLLSADKDRCNLLKIVYQNHAKEQKLYDPKIPFNLKSFMVQPVPFEMLGYILNMESLKINQYRKFVIDLQFFGPGRLIVAARTAIKIPGLTVDLKVTEKSSQNFDEFYYYCTEDTEEAEANYFHKPYRNMYERIIDLETDPKLKHAHSFDQDEQYKLHNRKITNKERKAITNYYNSLNKSLYEDRKHHCILCKLYPKRKEYVSGPPVRVVLLFKPTKRYYEDRQLVEDYIYIDLHMGPTLPILMRGLVKY